jgi:hypothetical protein
LDLAAFNWFPNASRRCNLGQEIKGKGEQFAGKVEGALGDDI